MAVLGMAAGLVERGVAAPDAIVVYDSIRLPATVDEGGKTAAELGFEQRKKYGDTTVDVLRAGRHTAIDKNPRRNGSVMKRALTPGTFDPITSGHLDVIARASQRWWTRWWSPSPIPRRKALCSRSRSALSWSARPPRICPTCAWSPSTACSSISPGALDATVVVKGLRAITDFEYEFQMTAMNYQLSPQLETLFIMSPPPQYVTFPAPSCARSPRSTAIWAVRAPCVYEALKKKYANLQ